MSLARVILSPFATWFGLLRNSWHSAAASVISQTLIATAAALAGRELGAAKYGSVVAIMAYCGWFSLLGSYPCCSLLPSFLATEKETEVGKRQAMATTLVLKFSVSVLATLSAYLLMPVLMPSVWNGPLHSVAAIYLITFAILPVRAAVDLVLQSVGWLRLWSISTAFGAALPVVALALCMIGPARLTPHTYVLLLSASALASIAFSFGLLSRRAGGVCGFRPRADMARQFLRAGRGPWFSVLGNALCVYGLKTIIATNLPSKQLGLYEIVFSFIIWVTAVGTAVTIPALSEWSKLFAAGDIAAVRTELRRCQRATGAVMGAVGLVSFMAARPILAALYGPEYVGAATVLRIMALSLALGGVGGWYWIAAYALGQPWRVALPNIVSNVAVIVLAFVLVRYTSLGIAGAALAYLLAVVIWLGIYEWELRRAFASATIARTATPAGPHSP